MDEKAVRLWGVIVGGGCIAAALAVAMMTGPQRETAAPASAPAKIEVEQPAPLAVIPPPASQVVKVADAGAETGETDSSAPVTFIVAFSSGHPLKRAQELEAQGQHARAVQTANTALRNQRELRGLCYDRFTVGGAEVVLRLCSPAAAGERASAQRRWSTKLASMAGVEYAEPNVVAQPEKR